MSTKVYEDITNRILEQMETHGTNWVMPFEGDSRPSAGIPCNGLTGRPYSGINVLLLGFTGGHWATYKAWQGAGYQVAKGEKGTGIIFFKQYQKEVDGEKKTFPVVRSFTVFSSAQLDQSVKEFTPPPVREYSDETEMVAECDEWVSMLDAEINHTGKGRACFIPSMDIIEMPNRELFSATDTSTATECYYSTLFHELTHWTGHKSRLDRLRTCRFGDKDYAFEELVAELGAAFLCASMGVSIEPRPDHAKYLNSWMRGLKEDPKVISTAARLAQKAVDYMHGLVEAETTATQEAA
jgi:antirestriction protein ArdC